MCEVIVGSSIKDWTDTLATDPESWKKALKSFESEPRGEGSEAFIVWLLSLTNGVVMHVNKGSKLDLMGVDIFFRGQGPTWGIQTKSSRRGMDDFLKNGNLSENIILLWVNVQDRLSRRKAFTTLYPFLRVEAKVDLLPQVKTCILKLQAFQKIGRTSFEITRRGVIEFNKDELTLLVRLGYLRLHRGYYVL